MVIFLKINDLLLHLHSGKIRDVAQPGSAHVWGAWGRWFESSRPDSIKNLYIGRDFFIKVYFIADLPSCNAGCIRFQYTTTGICACLIGIADLGRYMFSMPSLYSACIKELSALTGNVSFLLKQS